MFRRSLFTGVVCLLVLIAGSIWAAGELSDAEVRMERLRAERMANAEPTRLASAHYSIAGKDNTVVYMINKVADPIEVELSVLADNGDLLGIGRFLLEPNRHTTVPLRDALASAGAAYRQGSLRLDFNGDPDMVQAWAVLERGRQLVELPLKVVGVEQAWQRLAFWDARPFGGASPSFYVVNASDVAVDYDLRLGQDGELMHRQQGILAAGERQVVTPGSVALSLDHGWLWLETDGVPGSVMAVGLLAGDGQRGRTSHLSRLEVEASLQTNTFSEFSSLALPLGEAKQAVVSLFNGNEDSATADVQVVALDSGRELARQTVVVGPNGVVTLDARALAAASSRGLPQEGRLVVTGDRPLRIWSIAELADGDTLEVAVFGLDQAHQSGLYPLPSLDRHAVVSTFVNVGDQPTTILGQASWAGGAYALEPLTIPPGEARRIDFAALAADGAPDLLERRFDPTYRDGFFQWTARGSHEVIARTDVRPLDRDDRFGFNCGGCCPESSFGDLIPGSVMLDLDVSTSFAGVEKISTCSGVLGPYTISSFASLNYSSPVTWNGANISTTNVTDQTASFTAWGDEIDTDGYDCFNVPVLFGDNGGVQADDCQEDNHPNFDVTRSCGDQSSGCQDCFSCCDKQQDTGDCRCDKLPFGVSVCKTGVKTACQSCKQVCATQHSCSSTSWPPVC
ncbi:MAG: hypothetical protein AAGD38_19320 [Acidobacteriota bacterium]